MILKWLNNSLAKSMFFGLKKYCQGLLISKKEPEFDLRLFFFFIPATL